MKVSSLYTSRKPISPHWHSAKSTEEPTGFITTIILLSGFIISCLRMFQGPRREIVIFFFFFCQLNTSIRAQKHSLEVVSEICVLFMSLVFTREKILVQASSFSSQGVHIRNLLYCVSGERK